MKPYLANVTMDCADAEAQSAFYAALLDREVVFRAGVYVVVGPSRQHEPNLILQQVPDPTPGKARTHFDLHVTDLAATTAKAIALGATQGADVEELGLSWRVMHDPEGNPFCLTEVPEE